MKSLGIVDRLTRLPIAELDTVRRPSISTRVRLSPRLRSWIDDRPEFWVLPVTVESLSVDDSCGRSASVSLSSLFPDSSRSSLVMLTVGEDVTYVSRAIRVPVTMMAPPVAGAAADASWGASHTATAARERAAG